MSEQLAKLFHETYERLAPSFGYETRRGTAVPWDELPARNKNLMIAVADIIELEYFGRAKESNDELPNEFWTESGYGHNTRQPFVSVVYNGRKLAQMPPENAIELAHSLLACAESSLSDAFIVDFMCQTVGLEMAQAAGVLYEFRAWRDKREAQP